MAETFNPAPFDKYAETPKEMARGNRETQTKLKAGLVGTFPASDPVSVAQPLTTKHDTESQSLWAKITSLFKQ